MARIAKTRVQSSDVRKYAKMDTGTAGAPQKRSSKMAEGKTRVQSGGVASHQVKGTGKPSHANARMKKVRVTSGHTGRY